jgi:hypothetical protein
MKIIKWKVNSILAAAVVVSSIIFMIGCGEEVADSQGCPSGSYLANSTDTINVPIDDTFAVPSAVGAPASPQIVPYIIQFTVTDAQGVPRNNICVKLYTGGTNGSGTWYSNDTFSTIVTGSGPMNGVTAVTDDAGSVFLFWSTTTPQANFASGTTAGADIEGNSWISFTSGAISEEWIVEWTVEGEPVP